MADLITASEYKTYAGISGSGFDTVIGVLIDVVSEQVRLYCFRDRTTGFESGTKTEYYDGNDGAEIILKEWPVTALTSVDFVQDDGSLESQDTDGFRYQGSSGRFRYLGSQRGRFTIDADGSTTFAAFGDSPAFPGGMQNVKVVYTGGYSTIPDAIKYACYRAIDIAFARRRQDLNMQSESLGGYSYTRAQATPDATVAMLDKEVRGLLTPFRSAMP